jgi:hypothetical protein
VRALGAESKTYPTMKQRVLFPTALAATASPSSTRYEYPSLVRMMNLCDPRVLDEKVTNVVFLQHAEAVYRPLAAAAESQQSSFMHVKE